MESMLWQARIGGSTADGRLSVDGLGPNMSPDHRTVTTSGQERWRPDRRTRTIFFLQIFASLHLHLSSCYSFFFDNRIGPKHPPPPLSFATRFPGGIGDCSGSFEEEEEEEEEGTGWSTGTRDILH